MPLRLNFQFPHLLTRPLSFPRAPRSFALPASPLPKRAVGFAVCAALLSAAPSAAAQTAPQDGSFITVAKGDTAYSLARNAGLTVEELLELNSLATYDLEIGQVLRVKAEQAHQVEKGDTVYSLARRYGVSVHELLAANNLGEDASIEIGQVLTVPATLAYSARPSSGALDFQGVNGDGLLGKFPSELKPKLPQGRDWRSNALAMLGIPYVYGGNSEKGIDCSAFVVRVFQPLGVSLPRTSAAQARTGTAVSRSNLSAGDLIFFDTVGRGQVTHVGIYLGGGEFVNANSYLGKVAIDRLESQYWSPRYLGARRVLDSVQASGVQQRD